MPVVVHHAATFTRFFAAGTSRFPHSTHRTESGGFGRVCGVREAAAACCEEAGQGGGVTERFVLRCCIAVAIGLIVLAILDVAR